ncbi:MAG: maleylpyruvate isomerase N-terminal domain-containing protein [Bacteroidota bacterium]
MQPGMLIDARNLFALLDEKLIALLRSLSAAEWNMPTIAKLWTVKDIAAHLLDGNIRTLSMARDGYFGEQPGNIASYQDLLDYLNRLNADWVKAMHRISPLVLTGLLETTGKEFSAYMEAADLLAPAIFPVNWAGEEQSVNWFHIAREYTEKWIHQQQIRDAVNKPGIMNKELFYPFIDTFMRGLPYTYRNTIAIAGTTVQVMVTGEAGGSWLLVKTVDDWQLSQEQIAHPTSAVSLDPDTAWRLFSKGITPADALEKATILGEIPLGSVALSMVSVMA